MSSGGALTSGEAAVTNLLENPGVSSGQSFFSDYPTQTHFSHLNRQIPRPSWAPLPLRVLNTQN